MKSWTGGLRARILGLVALSALPAFGALVWVHIHSRNAQLAQRLESANRVAEAEAASETATVHDIEDLLSVLARVPALNSAQDQCGPILRAALKRSPFLANLGVIGKSGHLRCSALPASPSVFLGDRTYFRRAMDRKGFAGGGYEIGRITGVASVNFGYPISGSGGATEGVVFAALRVNALLGRAAGNLPTPGLQTALLDGSGQVLARLPHRIKSATKCPFPPPRSSASGTTDCDYAGRALPLGKGSSTLRVSVAVPTARLHAAASSGLWQEVATLSGLFFVLLALAWLGAERLLTRPIRLLSGLSRRIAAGDLDARAQNNRGAREIRGLAGAFNGMAAALKARDDSASQQLCEIERLSRVYRVMSGINRVLLRIRDVSEFRRAVCDVAVDEGGFALAWIARVEPGGGRIVPLAWAGKGGEELDELGLSNDPEDYTGRGPAGQVARTGRACFINDLDRAPELRPWRQWLFERGFRSEGALPLRFGRRGGDGLLILYSRDADFFDAAEQTLLKELAGDASLGFDLIETESELSWRTHHDLLTGLGNRSLLEDTLPQALAHADRRGRCCAVLMVMIQRFDELRGLHAQTRSDDVLVAVGSSLQERVYAGDLVVRLEGGTFAVLLDDLPDPAAAGVATARIMRGLGGTSVVLRDGEEIPCSLCGGVAVYPGDAHDPDELIRSALVAVRASNTSGSRYVFYSREMNDRIQERANIERMLGRALHARELTLAYQPIVDLRTRRIDGVEALARWTSPELGRVSPGVFIPLAEESGLIGSLGDWVLEHAAEQARAWRRAGHEVPHLGINVSARQLHDPGCVQRLMQSAASLCSEGIGLAIEVTETAVLENLDQAGGVLRDFRDIGAAVWMDDFGTGYSSLAYLAQLEIDVLKIDIRFVRTMAEDPRAATLVETIVRMAEGLGMRCLAEGIETEEQYRRLVELGCPLGQGFWFARPQSPDALVRYVGRPLPLQED